jgi:kynurenine formamidase
MLRCLWRMVALLAVLSSAGCVERQQPAQTAPAVPRIVDLTYAFDENTVYWPNNESFQHHQVAFGRTPTGYWYSSYTFSASEHGGTHLDSPIHFAEKGQSVEQIPIERHIGPGIKINIADKVSSNRDYRLSASDIQAWEQRMGEIPAGAIVLVHTGWGRHWGNRVEYLGTEKTNDASDLHFPGIAQDAAEYLARQRQVAMVGIDTPSLDYGPSRDFIAHQILNGANIPGLENVANTDQLPERGFLIMALPMKIAGGSGAPCRIVALFGR